MRYGSKLHDGRRQQYWTSLTRYRGPTMGASGSASVAPEVDNWCLRFAGEKSNWLRLARVGVTFLRIGALSLVFAYAAMSHAAAETRSLPTLNARAASLFSHGDFQGALAAYNDAIALAQNNAALYHNRGLARFRLRDLIGAYQDFDKAVSLSPRDADALNARGGAQLAMGMFAEALNDFDRALAIRPDDPMARENRNRAQSGLRANNARMQYGPTANSPGAFDRGERPATSRCDAIIDGYSRYYLGDNQTGDPARDRRATLMRAFALAESSNDILRGRGVALLRLLDFYRCVPAKTYPCDTPEQIASDGTRCGDRAASVRPGGR